MEVEFLKSKQMCIAFDTPILKTLRSKFSPPLDKEDPNGHNLEHYNNLNVTDTFETPCMCIAQRKLIFHFMTKCNLYNFIRGKICIVLKH